MKYQFSLKNILNESSLESEHYLKYIEEDLLEIGDLSFLRFIPEVEAYNMEWKPEKISISIKIKNKGLFTCYGASDFRRRRLLIKNWLFIDCDNKPIWFKT